MTNSYSRSGYRAQNLHWKHTLITALLAVVIVVVTFLAIVFFKDWRNTLANEKQELVQLWEEGVYDRAFLLSGEMLESKPMDAFLLTVRGFSAYQLAIAQINHYDTQTFLDEAIWALRKALLLDGVDTQDGRIQYVLGKAYYYKGFGYADLAVQFLEEALQASYGAEDIPEYLGLAYAAIHDYRSSVAAFSMALNPDNINYIQYDESGNVIGGTEGEEEGAAERRERQYPSDLLFIAIARSYIELDELDSAHAYLVRSIEISKDAKRIIAARLLVADILRRRGDSQGAEKQYVAIINESTENSVLAEAHYQLGAIYYTKDITKARAEWRKAIRIDPAHKQARLRLN